MSEEEFGQEFDRVIRAAMMALGQIREAQSRRAAARDREQMAATQAAVREQEQRTAQLRQIVGRQDFWDNATGARVANAATVGATLYNTDKNAAAVYDTVRDQSFKRFGVDVDELRSRFPDSEDARRSALTHAIDDRLAELRDEQLARDERAAAAERQQDATAERDLGDTAAQAGPAGAVDAAAHDAAADELEHDADDHEVAADGHEEARDRHHADANTEQASAASHRTDGDPSTSTAAVEGASSRTPATPAGEARQQLGTSYPQTAKQALAKSSRKRPPKGKSQASKQQPTRPRSSGLSR